MCYSGTDLTSRLTDLFDGEKVLEVLQLDVRTLLQVQQLQPHQVLGDAVQEVALQPDDAAELEVDEVFAAADDGHHPDVRHLPAPVELEGPEVGTVLGDADHSGIVQLGTLRQVQVEEIAKMTLAEGGYEGLWLQLCAPSDFEPFQL